MNLRLVLKAAHNVKATRWPVSAGSVSAHTLANIHYHEHAELEFSLKRVGGDGGAYKVISFGWRHHSLC